MKKVLILVLSCELPPYQKMAETALRTWDSIEVEGCETVYYFGESVNQNTDKFIYLPVRESLHNMTEKTFKAFGWALKNKEFDYIARPHSSIYVDKKELIKYVQDLPETNVFAGLKVNTSPPWAWGGTGYIFSKDVIEKLVAHVNNCPHNLMEDMALSYLINNLEIPYTPLKACSIDKKENGWLCLSYGDVESIEFTDFKDLKKLHHFHYRVKQDQHREVDEFIMNELFKVLN